MPKALTIDYETRSPIDIKKCGAYAYAASKYTEPMMLAVKCDEDDARMWIAERFRNLMDTEVSDEELEYLINSAEVLVAHNAFFERSITRFHMPFDLPLEKVRCTMAQACMCGLPRDLDSAAKIVSGGKYLKDKDGHTLMLSMSKPRRLVKSDCEELIPILNDLGYPLERSEWKKIQVMQKNLLETISLGKKPEDERLIPYFLVYRESQEEFVRLVEYARQDVRVEYMLYMNLPKIPESELKVWQLDQQINDRGVQVDVRNAGGIVKTLDDYTDTLEDEALAITDYQVTSVKSPSSILAWLGSNGVETTSIDKETIKYLLTLDLDPKVRKFLELRQALGKSSVAKYDTLLAEAFYDGRCHGLFVYHGAGTGRWAGAGVQPQNLPRPAGKKNLVDATMFGKDDEVYADELDAAMLASGDIDLVRMFWKDPMVLSADLIRTMFMAPEGKELVCADFSAVEGRGLAWLAGQTNKLEAYASGLDAYKVAASGIFKIPYEAVDGGGKGDQRQIGKTAELACFSGMTEVLTDSGWVAIQDITLNHKLWDGEKWATHSGVICNGYRKVIQLDGIRLTPDHLIFDGISWKKALDLVKRPESLRLALKSGEEGYLTYESSIRLNVIGIFPTNSNAQDAERKRGTERVPLIDLSKDTAFVVKKGLCLLCLRGHNSRESMKILKSGEDLGVLLSSETRGVMCPQRGAFVSAGNTAFSCNAIAEQSLIGLRTATSSMEERLDVRCARERRGKEVLVKNEKDSLTCAPIELCEESSCISSDVKSADVQILKTQITPITENVVSSLNSPVLKKRSNTFCPYRIAESRDTASIGLIITPDTSQEICDLRQSENNCRIEENSLMSKERTENFEPVYDIMNVGSKNRFLVRTKNGCLWGHNCGYGGGWNAMLRFGADKFGLTEEEGTAIVKAWREANNKIVEFWYALTRASVDAMRSPGERFYAGKYISFQKRGKFLTMRLPSGRDLYYPFPKLEDVEMPWSTEAKPAFKKVVTAMTQNMAKQWVREPLSHVKLSENATQATCRDLLVNAMFCVTEAGYDVVMHIHDEIVAEIDEGKGDLAEFESLMTKLPEWAKGLPLKAEGWIGKRYRK